MDRTMVVYKYQLKTTVCWWIHFLSRDATQSAVMPKYAVRLSVRQSVSLSLCDVQVCMFFAQVGILRK